jgi:hypothetical protein
MTEMIALSIFAKNSIFIVAMPPARLSDLFAKKFNAAGIHVYVHTVNNSA